MATYLKKVICQLGLYPQQFEINYNLITLRRQIKKILSYYASQRVTY